LNALRSFLERFGDENGAPEDGTSKADRRLLVGLTLAAFGLRVLSAARVQVIASDGVRYIGLARLFAAGDFRSFLADDYHPVYPLLIALVRPLVGGFETAAFVVPILLTAGTVPVVFFLFRPVFGRRASLMACVIFAFLPPLFRTGADTLSEGAFLFFLALGLCLGAGAFRRAGLVRAVLAGVACGAAYLTRPEGGGILLAFGLFTGLVLVAGLRNRRRLGLAGTGLLILAGFFAPGLPYLVHIRMQTGRWDLSMKKSAVEMSETLEERVEKKTAKESPEVEILGTGRALVRLGKEVVGNLYYVPALFVLAGLFLFRKRKDLPPRWEFLFLSCAALWAAVCFFQLISHGYLSHRHTLPIALFLLGYAGRGAVLFSDVLGPRLQTLRPFASCLRGVSGTAVLLFFLASLVFLTGLKENLRAWRADKVFVKEVARDLAHWKDPGGAAIGDLSRVSYYAGLRHVPLPLDADPAEVLAKARREKASLLVVEMGHLESWAPDLEKALETPSDPPPGFALAETWRFDLHHVKRVRAYRLASSGDASGE